MQVLNREPGRAECADAHARRWVDTLLIGDPEPGSWLLVDRTTALRKVDEAEARQVQDALAALARVQAGGRADGLFADLEAAGPQLPPHLREADAGGGRGEPGA
jgi:hydrogenase expression/formation protein HypC